ncbi:protein of unknown function [Streptantibioticus cattleyicolor NRRL 8057 = DSM 46488]|nr:protein of unknown function [Streptantibioticus cattleyicolor NRRL 8057 = DSM 46488]
MPEWGSAGTRCPSGEAGTAVRPGRAPAAPYGTGAFGRRAGENPPGRGAFDVYRTGPGLPRGIFGRTPTPLRLWLVACGIFGVRPFPFRRGWRHGLFPPAHPWLYAYSAGCALSAGSLALAASHYLPGVRPVPLSSRLASRMFPPAHPWLCSSSAGCALSAWVSGGPPG